MASSITTDDDVQRERTGRDVFDGPPRQPKLRVLAGGKSKSKSKDKSPTPSANDEDDDEINSPEGESRDEDDDGAANDMGKHPIVQSFKLWQQVEDKLTRIEVFMPGLMAPIEDLRQSVRQLLPQYAAAMLSGSPVANQPGAGPVMPGGGNGAGNPMQGGLSALAGMGGGPGAGVMQAAPSPLGAGVGGMTGGPM